ncbi:hypothetical protein BC828DRAFT_380605 [Blastocladiella britannica]|nr:hypothetical protein BC828DRAFT_380605 [Blastocladiella britannica]
MSSTKIARDRLSSTTSKASEGAMSNGSHSGMPEAGTGSENHKEAKTSRTGSRRGSFTSMSMTNLKAMIPRLPMAVLLAFLVGGSQIMLALVSRQIPANVGTATAIRFGADLQSAKLDQTVSNLQVHVDTAARLARIQRANWKSGVFGVSTPQLKTQTMTELLATLLVYDGVVSTQSFTTAAGGLNGYYASYNATTGKTDYTAWITDEQTMNYEQWTIDPAHPTTALAVTDSQANYNGNTGAWVTQVQPINANSPPVWSLAYAWGGIIWLTLSYALFDSNGAYVGVACTDLDLGFISSTLTKLIRSDPIMASSYMYVFETATTVAIGASDPKQQLLDTDKDGNSLSLNLTQLAGRDPKLGAVNNYLTSKRLQLTDAAAKSFTVPGYLVQIHPVTPSDPQLVISWVIIQLLPESTISVPIAQGTTTSAWVASGLSFASAILSILFALGISRVLGHVWNEMMALSRFEFHNVISNRTELKRTSRIKEVFELQAAFFSLVQAFSRQMKEGRRSDVSTSINSQSQTGTKMGGAATRTGHAAVPAASGTIPCA